MFSADWLSFLKRNTFSENDWAITEDISSRKISSVQIFINEDNNIITIPKKESKEIKKN